MVLTEEKLKNSLTQIVEMGRSPCCDENGLKKGPWTPEEDQKLVNYVQKHGHGSWRALPKLAGLNRCGKSCRLRWTNYLRPDIKRGKFSQDEEQTILHLHSILGNKWSAIASHLPGRTDNEIKNFWNTHLKKKLIQMGFDPMTHQPRTDDLLSSLTHLLALANLRNLMDHHSLMDDHAIQLAKLQYLEYLLQSAAPTGANSYTPNGNIPNMEAFTLSSLSSLSSTSIPDVKEKSVLSSLQITMENPPSFSLERETSQPLQYNPILALPDHLTAAPEVPFQNNDEMCQTSDPNSRYWVLPSPNYTAVNPPLVTDLSMNLQPEEGNSSNIYRGDQGPSPCWSELFETIY